MIDLSLLSSPILFQGDERTAYRDPAVLYHNQLFHLFYTLVEIEPDGYIYSYIAYSASSDLQQWTPPTKLTPRDQELNYSSPGNVIWFNNEWLLCLQTYPRSNYTAAQIPRYGDSRSRLFLMRSPDLIHWSAPELIRVKGPDVEVEAMGRMIDPYLCEDKDQPGLWWCFYKQQGVSMSSTRDFRTWAYLGAAESGENVCVLVEDSRYILFQSPENGIGIKRSDDLRHWEDWGALLTLGQAEWPWAQGRITAGAVIDLREVPGIAKYLMVFHGSGPGPEQIHFDSHASLGLAWSDDLLHWEWPKQA